MKDEVIILKPKNMKQNEDSRSINEVLDQVNNIDLLEIVAHQYDEMKCLDENVRKSMELAANAKKAAESAKEKSVGFGKKKAAIEELQEAGVALAEAVESSALAQQMSLGFQKRLAEISQYLFGLGVTNIAMNRTVVRELEMKLQGASEEELSELAQQEIISVIKQLKAQEDIIFKQENMQKNIAELKGRLEAQIETNNGLERIIALQQNNLSDYEKKIHEFNSTLQVANKELEKQNELNKVYDEKLTNIELVSQSHDQIIIELNEQNKGIISKLDTGNHLTVIHEQSIQKLIYDVDYSKKQIESIIKKKINVILLIVAIMALLLSILGFIN